MWRARKIQHRSSERVKFPLGTMNSTGAKIYSFIKSEFIQMIGKEYLNTRDPVKAHIEETIDRMAKHIEDYIVQV